LGSHEPKGSVQFHSISTFNKIKYFSTSSVGEGVKMRLPGNATTHCYYYNHYYYNYDYYYYY